MFVLAMPALGASASATATAAPSPVYGIHPGLLGKTTLPGNHFGYALPAGASQADSVVVENFTANPLTVSVYPADLIGAAGGGLAPTQAGPQHQVGAWIRIARSVVVVPAHGQVTDPFELNVPAGTAPGSYYGAVVATRNAGTTSTGLAIQTRVALIVDLTVPGTVHVALDLHRPVAHRQGSREAVTVTITNHSNVTVTLASPTVDVRNGALSAARSLKPAGVYILPGGQATLTASYGPLPLIGRLRLTARTDALVNARLAGRYTSPTLTLSFFPWTGLLILLVATAATAALVAFGRRPFVRRRAWRREERKLVADLRSRRRLNAN